MAVSSRSLLAAALSFACVGICIYKARQFADASPTEQTAIAQSVYVNHYRFPLYLFHFHDGCDYTFSVDGTSYSGHGDCPQRSAYGATIGKLPASDGFLTGLDIPVYYDPSNPSTNSLLELSVASRREYRGALPWIGIGLLIIFGYVFSAGLRANQRAKRGESVDAGEAVVYPGQAGYAHSPELRDLYLQVVNRIHPDRAWDEADRMLRERLMKQANAAFERGDAGTLREVLEEYRSATSTT